ncbi:MAG: hypothetical protein ACKPKO_21435, partial [Candidatus Fonsibacter sp.]
MDVHAPVYCAIQTLDKGPGIWKHLRPKALIIENLDGGGKQAWRGRLHITVEAFFAHVGERLEGSLSRDDTNTFWRCWSG